MNMLAGCSSGSSGGKQAESGPLSCVVTPRQTEGTYFVDEHLLRSDIRSDPSDGSIKEGLPLALEIRVYTVDSVVRPSANRLAALWWTSGTAMPRESIRKLRIAVLILPGKNSCAAIRRCER